MSDKSEKNAGTDISITREFLNELVVSEELEKRGSVMFITLTSFESSAAASNHAKIGRIY